MEENPVEMNIIRGASAIVGAYLIGILPLSVASAQCRTDEPRVGRGGKIEWREDIEVALEHAKNANRPSIIYFSADW